MQKYFRPGYLFFTASFLFLIVAAVSERPVLYIGLGAVFLILGLAAMKKSDQKPPEEKPQE